MRRRWVDYRDPEGEEDLVGSGRVVCTRLSTIRFSRACEEEEMEREKEAMMTKRRRGLGGIQWVLEVCRGLGGIDLDAEEGGVLVEGALMVSEGISFD